MGLVIKCRALRRELGGRGGFIHAPTHKCIEILNKGKFSYFYRKLKRQSNEEVIKCPPSYKTRIKDGQAVPPLAEYMKGYKKNCSKLICHQKRLRTVSTFSIAKHGQIRKNNGKIQPEERTAVMNADCVGGWKIPCTYFLIALSTPKLLGKP